MSTRSPSVSRALASALTDLPRGKVDEAAVALAKRYADAIDSADDPADVLDRLGPKLLAALTSLGMTPAARAAVKGGGIDGGSNAGDVLARLRAERAAR